MDFNNDFFHVLKRLSDTDKILYLVWCRFTIFILSFIRTKKKTCLTVKMNGFEKILYFQRKFVNIIILNLELKFEDNIISENIDEILTKQKNQFQMK